MKILIETSHWLPPNAEQSVFDALTAMISRQASSSNVESMTIKVPYDQVELLAERARIEGVIQYLKVWPVELFGSPAPLNALTPEMQLGLVVENASRRSRASLPGDDDQRRVFRITRDDDDLAIHFTLPPIPRIPAGHIVRRSG